MLAQAADRIEAWFEAAWSFWLERGLDPNGLFYEQVDLDGRPDPASPRRVRVQARQLFTTARAVAAGHRSARPVLERAFPVVEARCWDPSGGWIHLLGPDGTAQDRLRDTYDQAFMLFGLCEADAAGLPGARALADRTLDFIDQALLDRSNGSVREGVPPSLPRRANPHMHLLEAMLAWHARTSEAAFLDRADRIAGLFRSHFFDPVTGTVGEYFTDDLRPAALPEGGAAEPGHQFEWSWLLHRLAKAGGMSLLAEAGQLYRTALAHGLGPDGFAVDECDRSGRQTRRTRRTWPQTELIKSHLVNGAPGAAAETAIAVLDSYLATRLPGLWIDQFDEAGRPCVETVPASTLYHLVIAFEELLRAAGRPVA